MSTVATDAPSAGHQQHPNQFALLRQRRFAPFFWTQFAGAANDNLFTFAFIDQATASCSPLVGRQATVRLNR